DLAKQGKRVLRLKGGDPFVFGRGGEEIEALSENGIAFQVVPGVSAANGCAAYAGIPLTHRDHAQACVFVTGHEKDGELKLNWESLIQPRQTVVLYMGLSSLDAITRGFLSHGANPATPAAVIENGTRAGQRVITGTLESLLDKTAMASIKSPALIIVGSVVSLREKLSWFANRPKDE
ncbi:MAG: uroporphyrinogen-III C-methyltransferase, partial [Lysobacterales bacterium]